jgi:hypothetical protein
LFGRYFLYVIVFACFGGLLSGQFAAHLVGTLNLGSSREVGPIYWCAFYLGWLLGTASIVFVASSLNLLWAAGSERVRRASSLAFGKKLRGLAWQSVAAGLLVGPFIGLVAVGIAGNHISPVQQPALFFAGWLLSVLAAGIIRVMRHE